MLPLDYFEEETERALRAIGSQGIDIVRLEEILAEVSTVLNSVRVRNTWRGTAVLMYRNWLEHLCAQKRHDSELMFGERV